MAGGAIPTTPSISGDGRYVAFQSSASNLVSGDTNGYQDIFVKDLVSGRHHAGEHRQRGSPGQSATSCSPRASAATGGTWRFIATPATWSPATPMGMWDIFVKDLVSRGHHAGEHRQLGSPGQWRFLLPEHQRRRAVRGV